VNLKPGMSREAVQIAVLLRTMWDDDHCDLLAEQMAAHGCRISHTSSTVKGAVLEADFYPTTPGPDSVLIPADYITVTVKLPVATEVSSRCEIRFESAIDMLDQRRES
jgi:hypothetical protein